MNTLNKKLTFVAAVLVGLAAFTYLHGTGRADRFEAGQKFLQNLNPDEIGAIAIASGAAGSSDAGVTLDRQGDEFVLAERNGYPARNEEVNRLVRDLLDVTLERRMGQGDDVAEELGLTSEDALAVTLKNGAGEEMVSLRLGETADNGGRYVQRTSGEDQAIYRTESAFSVSNDPGTFLRTEIVDHASSEVVRIQGPDFLLAKDQDEDGNWEGGLQLRSDDGSAAEGKESEINKLSSILSRLSFDEVFLASADEVRALSFDRQYVFELDDKSGYRLEIASQGDETYLRIGGLFNVDRLEVSQEETDEELEQKAAVLRRSEEIADFEQFHGSWVYRIDDSDAATLSLFRSDLVE